jgi:hypothetical protein
MRHFRRFIHLKKSWFAVPLAASIACTCAAASVRAAAASAEPQTSSAASLPQAWNDALGALADKIAGTVSPSHPMTLTVKNISSLDQGDVETVRAGLETKLAQHHFRVSHSAAAETQLDVTLSDSGTSYVWVAEIRAKENEGHEPEIAVVSVAKSSGAAGASTGATLAIQKTLVWQQSTKFLDFHETAPADGSGETLAVLEPSRIAIYSQTAGKWDLDHEAPIAHKAPWPRDVRGNFGDASGGAVLAMISGVTCTGSAAKGAQLACAGTPLTGDAAKASLIPGRETGEAALLKSTCGDAQVALASGNADWTQPDTIRGYLLRKKSATASGAALDLDGPVLSLTADGDGEARAIVLNLKTGNYEGYRVAATCGE